MFLIFNEMDKNFQQGMEEPFFKLMEQKSCKVHNLNLNEKIKFVSSLFLRPNLWVM